MALKDKLPSRAVSTEFVSKLGNADRAKGASSLAGCKPGPQGNVVLFTLSTYQTHYIAGFDPTIQEWEILETLDGNATLFDVAEAEHEAYEFLLDLYDTHVGEVQRLVEPPMARVAMELIRSTFPDEPVLDIDDLQLPDSPLIRDVLPLVEREGTGEILGLSLVLQPHVGHDSNQFLGYTPSDGWAWVGGEDTEAALTKHVPEFEGSMPNPATLFRIWAQETYDADEIVWTKDPDKT